VGVHTALTSLNHPVVQLCEAVICDTCEGGEGGGGCVRRGKRVRVTVMAMRREYGVESREWLVMSGEWGVGSG